MVLKKIISKEQIQKRQYWVEEIARLSGRFGDDSQKVEQELSSEINKLGIKSLVGHLRLCGAIPEKYGHDTSEEKLYSKYTDIVLHEAFKSLGFSSCVLRERADVADIECVNRKYSFVADAKAFRMSRTAKNQKDFKVQTMDGWKNGKPYAMVVCPIYQLPSRESQIYQQAASRSVCVLSYTHLSVLVRYAEISSKQAMRLLFKIFKTVESVKEC